jgi:hypothetical protein
VTDLAGIRLSRQSTRLIGFRRFRRQVEADWQVVKAMLDSPKFIALSQQFSQPIPGRARLVERISRLLPGCDLHDTSSKLFAATATARISRLM